MLRESRAPAVRRAVRALDAVAHQQRARPADLARTLDVPKSSLSDLVGTLLEERMLARSGDDLVLGTAFVEWAAGFVGSVAMLRRFGIGWERSAVLRDHTVTLQALIGSHSVCAAVRIGTRLLPYTPRAGSRMPLWPAEGPEPVLRVISRADGARILDAFAEGSPDDAALRAWAHREPEAAAASPSGAAAKGTPSVRLTPTGPAPSASGNLELNALVSRGEERGGAVVATLHLAPSHDADLRVLQAALDEFARDLRARPAS